MKTVLLLLAAVAAGTIGYLAGAHLGAGPGPTPVSVETTPPAAAVYLDGTYQGLSPLTLAEVPPGKHQLRAEIDGQLPARQIFEAPVEEALRLELAPAPRAALAVTSEPTGATVVVDGRVRGRTPLRLDDLVPGRHAVEVTATNYIAEERQPLLSAESEEKLHLALRHRQVEAYREQIQQTPDLLGTYNDLGELLFVLDRFEEAAQAYVQGLSACTQEIRQRNPSNAYEYDKLRSYPRARRGRSAAFRLALDRDVLAAVRKGERAPLLLDYFYDISERSLSGEYLDMFEKLLEHDLALAGRFVESCRRMDELPRGLNFLRELSRRELPDSDLTQAGLSLLRSLQGMGNDEQKSLLEVANLILETARKRSPDDLAAAALLLQAQSALHKLNSRQDEAFDLLKQAVVKGDEMIARAEKEERTNQDDVKTFRSEWNTWRMDLVEEMRRREQVREALELCLKVRNESEKRDPAVRRAHALDNALQKEVRELERREKEELKKRQEEERKKQEAERKKREEEERRRQEAERRKQEEERKKREAEEQKKREAEEQKKREEAARLQQEAERKQREEEERKKQEAEQKQREEEARKAAEAAAAAAQPAAPADQPAPAPEATPAAGPAAAAEQEPDAAAQP